MKLGIIFGSFVLVYLSSLTRVSESAACPSKLDLVFMVDSSGSIRSYNWEILTDFLVLVVDRFQIGQDAVRVAVVRFASSPDVMWKLDSLETYSKSKLKKSLKKIYYSKGSTSTPLALNKVATAVLGQPGDRPDVDNLVVVVTDGKSNIQPGNLKKYADKLHNKSRVISIGISSRINYNELLTIASSHCNVYTVDDFNQMDNDMDSTMDLICGCMPGQKLDTTCNCRNCPVNTYQPGWAQTSCIDCGNSGTTMGVGSTQCIDYCEPGYMVKSDGTGCEMCSTGTYQPSKNIGMCIPCKTGLTTLQAGATSENMCILLCPKGQRPNQNTKTCELCPKGTYKPTSYSLDCMDCPANQTTYSDGAKDVDQCINICDAGRYYSSNTTSCEPCQKDYYKDVRSEFPCKKCPSGKVTPDVGADGVDHCIDLCDPGQYYNFNTSSCDLCPKNYYKDNWSEMLCKKCPDGTITSDPGAVDPDECYVPRGKQTSEKQSGGNTGVIAGVVTAVLVLIIAAILLLLYFLFIRRKRTYGDSEATDFKVPPKDDGHVYHEPQDGNVYENPAMVSSTLYDNLSNDKTAAKASHDDVEYSNANNMNDDVVYSNATEIKKTENTDFEGPNYNDPSSQNLSNPIYDNHDLLIK